MAAKTLRTRGFTLIETLVVVVVIGIMLTLAMPSTRNATATQRQVSLDKFAAAL